jgi:Restriction endonuclease
MAESWCSLYDEEQFRQSILTELESSDTSLAESEIRAGIVAAPERALLLSPRRFEQVVAGVYRDLGYEAVLTRSSKDRGRDIILYGKVGATYAIVEVKRYKSRVGVEIVRQLRGVQLREGTDLAILVSASGFTLGAEREASDSRPVRRGYSMMLQDISDLLDQLGLTEEPLVNCMASSRERDKYRRWFGTTFDLTNDTGAVVNPTIRSGDTKTIVPGWWRT